MVPVLSDTFPQQPAGVLAALAGMAGMVMGSSLAPQYTADHREQAQRCQGTAV